MKGRASETAKKLFRSLDECEKQQILDWLNSIEKIRNDSTLSQRQKESRLAEVKTGETVFGFLSSVIDVSLGRVAPQKKGMVKVGLAGLGIALTALNFEATTISFLVLNKAIPKFLNSPRFTILSDFLKHHLELQHP